MSLKIIDFERKGNVIRFYLGKKIPFWGWTKPGRGKPSDTFYGYNWDVAPYQHNAWSVDHKFVYGHYDIYVPFDLIVADPGDYWDKNENGPVRISKNALVNREMPAIEIFDNHMCYNSLCELYIGDELEKITFFGFPGSLYVPDEEKDSHEHNK